LSEATVAVSGMGVGGREKLCLLIHTCFALHTEKHTGIWLNAECLAMLAVYVYVISGKIKNIRQLGTATRSLT
jgi:hypothetical protein